MPIDVDDREIWRAWLSYGTLASALLAVLVAWQVDDLYHAGLPVVLGLVTLAAAWMWFWIDMHPAWQHRRWLMVVFLLGLLVINLLLVLASPLFGIFTWTGYIFVGYAMPGTWQLAGVVPVAAVNALSQVGGWRTLAQDDDGPVIYSAVLLCNLLIAGIMTFVAIRTDQESDTRIRRIDQLGEANARLATALRENAGLHAQLLVQAHEAGVLNERQRMAGEIHDVLAQGLTGIVTQLEAAESVPADRDRHLATAKRLARESLTEARRSVQALRPEALDAARLPDVLDEVIRSWAGMHEIRADLTVTGVARPMLPEIETTLLRTAQEALANVAKHAAAARVGLTLSYMEDVVTLDVRDDGAGFDPAAPREVTDEGGFGLRAMRERLTRIAGTLEVESEPGTGTALSACVPAIVIGGAA
ncbi:sensor histidine kinase [Actinoplanes derwentensis]|uniref:Signal transduction histidine kinase n=1 Tax=Actinoplanes derwentensis TaxID=113562 RepID=A0A1H2D9X7_9ACTN|nr:sensor histidine kinase [Actinoplanes derwentensis]GID81592.1 histidine kinase [Actinoplanes derwentensis]SDT79384.1 Signal transduction histidine kinase [Actinoplanes derwentensis]